MHLPITKLMKNVSCLTNNVQQNLVVDVLREQYAKIFK